MNNSWDDIVGTDAYNKNLARLKGIATDKEYILNADEERVEKVIGLMTMNYYSHMKYYCPCKQSHPIDPAKDVLCPCPELDAEIAKEGNCFCRLFYKGT